MSAPATLMDLLGLSEDELCRILDTDPLELLSDELDHRPEIPILLRLCREAEEHVGAVVLRRWVRATGPSGRPVDALLERDFPQFEAAVEELLRRGFVLRRPR